MRPGARQAAHQCRLQLQAYLLEYKEAFRASQFMSTSSCLAHPFLSSCFCCVGHWPFQHFRDDQIIPGPHQARSSNAGLYGSVSMLLHKANMLYLRGWTLRLQCCWRVWLAWCGPTHSLRRHSTEIRCTQLYDIDTI